VLGDGVVAFEHLHHDRARGHVVDQLAVERALLVDFVELLGLFAGHADPPLGDDAQAGVLDDRIDLAGDVAGGGVRLDDREGAFGHGSRVVAGAGRSRGEAAPIEDGPPPANPGRICDQVAPTRFRQRHGDAICAASGPAARLTSHRLTSPAAIPSPAHLRPPTFFARSCFRSTSSLSTPGGAGSSTGPPSPCPRTPRSAWWDAMASASPPCSS